MCTGWINKEKNMKSKKVFLVLERKALKILSYVNDELYKDLYPRYLRKIGINIPEDYREGKSGYIDPSAYFDGSDYRLISIGKNTTISRDVVVLTHDFSIVKGLQAIGQEATGHFLKPVEIGENCFIGARCLILPGTEIGDNRQPLRLVCRVHVEIHGTPQANFFMPEKR